MLYLQVLPRDHRLGGKAPPDRLSNRKKGKGKKEKKETIKRTLSFPFFC